MKLTKWIKLILMSGCVLTMTACHHKQPQSQIPGDVNDEYLAHRSAQSSGLGSDSSFGDEAVSRVQHGSRHVYYFDYDSNVVHSADIPAIVANAAYLRAHPNAKVLLEGHTDPRGSREYNIGLGERRAKAVGDVLVERGVSPSQIRIVSYGAEKLAVPGHTEAAYQQDRRVVLVYLRR